MDGIYQALAHETRREILGLLARGEMSAGEIAQHFDIAKPTLSGHLAKLHQAGLVRSRRDGTRIIYSMNMTIAEELVFNFLRIIGRPASAAKKDKSNGD